MPEVNIASLSTTVLWFCFAASCMFGFVAHRSNFCTMGAVSDVVNMGDWNRARMWALALAVAIAGVGVAAYFGKVDPLKSFYTAPRFTWASYLVGGLMFGFGMVLASGCASKTIIRMGGGSLKALVVFLVLGISSFATLKGITAVLRVNTVDKLAPTLAPAQDLPSLLAPTLGMARPLLGLVLALAITAVLLVLIFRKRSDNEGEVWLGGLGVGASVLAVWWITGSIGHVEQHPDTLEEVFLATNSGRAESLSFVAPSAYLIDWLVLFSDKSKLLTVGIVSVFGTFAGALANALASRSFRWEAFRDVEDMGNHVIGAALMGVGGVTAMGCTVGQGLSGLSTLALGSALALVAIIAGGVLGIRYQVYRLEQMV
jgi:uncharacterized protein